MIRTSVNKLIRLTITLIVLSLLSIFFVNLAPPELAQTKPGFVETELLVRPKDGVSNEELKKIVESLGAKPKKVVDRLNVHVIEVPVQALAAIEKALQNNPKVQYAEKNILGKLNEFIPNDPYFSSQWHLRNTRVTDAWSSTMGSAQVPIAVLDTGFDVNNTDIASKLINGYNASTGSSDYTGFKSCSSWGHGTPVASTAAGRANEGIGSAGIASDNPIIPVVVFDSACNLNLANTAAGVIWAADHGARVINMSIIFYWSPPPQTLIDAINYAINKGVVVVAAAGNDNTTLLNGIYPPYPQSIANVLTVAATDSNNVRTSFSNFGSYVSIAAPGYDVRVTGANSSFGSWWGTSFSSPIVAGIAGLVIAANPGLTNLQVIDILKKTAQDLGSAGYDQYYGHGLVNAAAAVQMALITTPEEPPPPPAPTDTMAPSAPGNLNGSFVLTTVLRGKKAKITADISLSWSASTDNMGVVKYTVYRNGTKIADTTNLNYTDSSLAVGRSTYSYYVIAYDQAGNASTRSNTYSVTPK